MTDKFEPVLRFMVVSDVHYKDEHTMVRDRFEKAIKCAYRYAESCDYKNLDALYVVGDFATSGSEIQMKAFKETIDNNIKPGTEVTLTLASHEFSQANGGEEAALERFDRIFNMPPDTHKVINGFHFIGITTTNGCRFSDEKIEYAAKSLREAANDDPKKPIFFFQHPHITNTVYGSILWGEDELIPTLVNYPQVIDFSGHSHAPINDPRSIHQKHFTSVGTGTLYYFELDEFDKIYGTIPPDKEEAAQMLIVEADKDNRVRIYTYDVLTENFFAPPWEIDEPSNPESFKYTDKRYVTAKAPYFPAGSKLDVNDITDTGCSITFTQAEDEPYVNGYDIYVYRKADKVLRRKICVWSHYYLYNMPETVTQLIDDLESNTEYEIKVYANSFWKTVSSDYLSAEIKTK